MNEEDCCPTLLAYRATYIRIVADCFAGWDLSLRRLAVGHSWFTRCDSWVLAWGVALLVGNWIGVGWICVG